jgi:hypothetical protein
MSTPCALLFLSAQIYCLGLVYFTCLVFLGVLYIERHLCSLIAITIAIQELHAIGWKPSCCPHWKELVSHANIYPQTTQVYCWSYKWSADSLSLSPSLPPSITHTLVSSSYSIGCKGRLFRLGGGQLVKSMWGFVVVVYDMCVARFIMKTSCTSWQKLGLLRSSICCHHDLIYQVELHGYLSIKPISCAHGICAWHVQGCIATHEKQISIFGRIFVLASNHSFFKIPCYLRWIKIIFLLVAGKFEPRIVTD